MYVKLALTGRAGEIRVSWISATDLSPEVHVSTRSGHVEQVVSATTSSYR